MSEKVGFWKGLNKSKIRQIAFFLMSMTILVVVYCYTMRLLSKRYEIVVDDYSWVYQVESKEIEGNEVILRGFAFELDKNAPGNNYEILLSDVESGKTYFPKMRYIERENINAYFACEYDYTKSGFEAEFNAKKICLEEKDYEILLWKEGDREAYQTGVYLSKGEFIYTNPREFEPLEVEGTNLEEVVKNGKLRVYRPDYGMYVYQYEENLYWIADKRYMFEEDGSTNIQYQLSTTQINNLPQYRLDNEWYWDDMEFEFESNEMLGVDFGEYRVAVMSIPKEYSISRIWTGYYVDGWLWIQNFRPYYELK